jgi:hypothetical protein
MRLSQFLEDEQIKEEQLNEDLTIIMALAGAIYLIGFKATAALVGFVVAGALSWAGIEKLIQMKDENKLKTAVADAQKQESANTPEAKSAIQKASTAAQSGDLQALAAMMKKSA